MTIKMSWYSFLCGVIFITQTNSVDFNCWPESEQNTLSYANNPNKTIDTLPSVRLFQGYYGSQWAAQYAAYVYLTEQLGVNVTWYPSEQTDILYDDDFDDSPGYPDYYFKWMEEDKVDLLFEIWPVAMELANSLEYFDNGTVLDGGNSGIYGEGGWFIPQYMVDYESTSIVPKKLKYNDTLRDQFIDALIGDNTTDGNINWIAEFYNIRPNLTGYGFDYPDYDNPTVYGSGDTYGITLYSRNLTNNYFDGSPLDWNFAPFGDEGALSAFILDMYQQGRPFIANLYSPHVDFATIFNDTSGELMEFQRVAFERNPSNTVQDECFVAATCRQPLIQLNKIGNPKLADSFPEMVDFLNNFAMDATDVNEILLYQRELEQDMYEQYNTTSLNSSSISISWLNASCIWLKENLEDITETWNVDITRQDCLGGCGFDYYYDTNNNKVDITDEDDYVGGTCNVDDGECECVSQYLFDDCTTSCPGLQGPYLIENENGSSNEYMFKYCSGNGVCDVVSHVCQCYEGYGNKEDNDDLVNQDCSYKYPIYTYPTTLVIVFGLLFGFMIIGLILSLAWLYKNLKFATVRAVGPYMTCLFTIGLIFLAGASIVEIITPVTSLTCNLSFYLYGLGGILAVMSPLLKAYRVAVIYYNSLKKFTEVQITDKQLTRILLVPCSFELAICVFYTIFHELEGGTVKRYNDDYLYIQVVCNDSDIVTWIGQINYMLGAILLVVFCYFAVRTRAASKIFKESNCAYFGSFFTLFTFFIVVIFYQITKNATAIITIQVAAMAILLSVVWALFYGVRMYRFYNYPQERQRVTVLNSKMTMTPEQKRNMHRKSSRETSGYTLDRSNSHQKSDARDLDTSHVPPMASNGNASVGNSSIDRAGTDRGRVNTDSKPATDLELQKKIDDMATNAAGASRSGSTRSGNNPAITPITPNGNGNKNKTVDFNPNYASLMSVSTVSQGETDSDVASPSNVVSPSKNSIGPKPDVIQEEYNEHRVP